MENDKLRKVPIEYLWVGLNLQDNLYNYNGDVLLLPKGTTLTPKRFDRLYKFESKNHYITTYDQTYNLIMEKSASRSDIVQKIEEDQSGYTDLKLGVEDILKRAKNVRQIFPEEIQSRTAFVSETFLNANPLELFKCIDMPRPMDEDLQRHSLNVALLNGLMGKWLNLSEEEIELLITAGTLHDIGKTRIDEKILNAPRKLNQEEFEMIKMHPSYSYGLLDNSFDERIRQAVFFHHEKIDGSGYPLHLEGNQIPLFAKITSISDIYDALISKRSYKEENLILEVLHGFYKSQYGTLDSTLVTVFLNNMRKFITDKDVTLSDSTKGIIRYIPPNDFRFPIVEIGNNVLQTNESLYCVHLT